MVSMGKKKVPTRIVGIDFGLARIGVALSDETKLIATPWMTVAAEKKLDRTVAKLLAELDRDQKVKGYTVAAIVVGLPLMMDGTLGFLADEVRHFVELLKTNTAIPIATWDERLTSVLAERSLRESEMSRKKRSKVVDKVSAAIILQNYLDSPK